MDNAERGGCGVDNGLDRGRVDVVADDVVESPARDVPTHDTSMDKKSIKPTTRTLQQHSQIWQSQNNNQGQYYWV